jgi:FAD/FMN-containing dehydrogenase
MTTYFSLSAALEPWCIILPESAKDVSAALKIIDRHQCPFGLRSGGHGTHALSNSVSDGVTIDLGMSCLLAWMKIDSSQAYLSSKSY